MVGQELSSEWRRPRKVYADRGYDHDKYRQPLRQRAITPVIARRGTARLRPRPAALGRGTHLRLAPRLPTAPLPTEAAHRTLIGQPKNPARVCTSHSGSSSQG